MVLYPQAVLFRKWYNMMLFNQFIRPTLAMKISLVCRVKDQQILHIGVNTAAVFIALGHNLINRFQFPLLWFWNMRIIYSGFLFPEQFVLSAFFIDGTAGTFCASDKHIFLAIGTDHIALFFIALAADELTTVIFRCPIATPVFMLTNGAFSGPAYPFPCIAHVLLLL